MNETWPKKKKKSTSDYTLTSSFPPKETTWKHDFCPASRPLLLVLSADSATASDPILHKLGLCSAFLLHSLM